MPQNISKVVYGNRTLIDLSADTISADKVLSGYTAHDSTGTQITGTAGASVSGTNLIIPSSMGSVSGTNLTLV